MTNHIIKILLFILLLSSITFSQTELDTLQSVQSTDTAFVMEKSPMGAVLRSAVIPGWGQFYTEAYWKIPVVWGFLGYFTYVWIDNNNSYNKYKDLYKDSNYEIEVYKTYRDFYKDQRDEFAIYIGLTYFLQLVDAYVNAHLFDFEVKPDPYTNTPQLGIKFYF